MLMARSAPLFLHDLGPAQARICAACDVRRSALFGALGAAGLARIHDRIASPSLAADARLYARGEAGGAMYTVRSGIVRLERVTEGGQRRIVRVAGRGDLVGQEALLRRPYSEDAVACTPVQVCRISHTLIDEVGTAEPALLRELMSRWQQALDAAAAWTADLTAGAARRRMLKLLALLERHADDEGLIWLPRRDEMGDMLDLTIETTSRQLSRFRREGILELQPPRQARVDIDRLQAALREIDR